MQSLEQIRARNAFKANEERGHEIHGTEGGELIKKIPNLILNHGLLAVAANALEKENKGYRAVFDCIAIHLEELELVPQGCKTSEDLMKYLIGQSGREVTSQDLKLATAETMAWLHYARRFIQKPKKND